MSRVISESVSCRRCVCAVQPWSEHSVLSRGIMSGVNTPRSHCPGMRFADL